MRSLIPASFLPDWPRYRPCAGRTCQPDTGRLPATAAPLHYTLDARADPAQSWFSGEARIRVRPHEPVRSLSLHVCNVDVKTVEVVDMLGRRRAARVHVDEALADDDMVDIDSR